MSETRELVGGPYDGAVLDYVGPYLKVPLRREVRATWSSGQRGELLSREPRIGIYRELTPLQEGARHVGEPIYLFEKQ